MTFKDYLSFRNCETSLTAFPKRPLILTFDDGYLDNYTNLLPMMKRYGFRGVIFLLGDPSIRYNFWDADSGEHRDELMNTEQKKEFVESGWEIGAHSMTHANLTTLDDEKAYYEIAQSKADLEKDMGTEIVSFAYPTGYCDERIKELVKRQGYGSELQRIQEECTSKTTCSRYFGSTYSLMTMQGICTRRH